jgi:hypothetical protein
MFIMDFDGMADVVSESNGRKASPNQMKGVFSLRQVNIDWLRHQTLIEPSQANPEATTKHLPVFLRALVSSF